MILFALLEFSIMKQYLNSKNWEPEYCDYGVVVDKYIKYDKNDNDKDYYIIVKVNQNNLKYKVKLFEYQILEEGEEVVIFAIENQIETFISKKALNDEKEYAYEQKSLLEPRIPNDDDLQDFENWKRRKCNSLIASSVFYFIIVLMFTMISFVAINAEGTSPSEMMLPIFMGLVFIAIILGQIKKYFDIKKWNMEYCNHGVVIDKKAVSKKKHRRYYITVSSNENTFRENARSEFSILNIGDEAIIFTIEGKKQIYIAKKSL